MAGSNNKKLIFVVGVWRSGTSLLHAMLNNHPQIALMFEAEPFGIWPLKGDYRWPDDWPERLDFLNQCLTRHRLDTPSLPRRAAAADCLKAIFAQYAQRKPGVTVCGCKSPTFHQWLPQIAAIFPEAEFIIIWRNPLDACRSVVQAGRKNVFFGQYGMLTRTLFGAEKLARGVEHLKASGRRVHELTYSGLVGDPEAEMRRICGFLGLPFDAKMTDLASADISMLPGGEHHQGLRARLLAPHKIRDEVLSEEFIAKGLRYENLWRERFAGLRFPEVLTTGVSSAKPVESERLQDWLAKGFWMSVTSLKRIVFRKVPLVFWAWLRSKIIDFRAARLGLPGEALASAGESLTFSIITPSFRNSEWLKLCIASVADQQGVRVEHIVQDSCSDDGTGEWLPHDPRVKAFIEKDSGMYDAVNRGYRRATGDILAYLNCDEQYLPGALAKVRAFFAAHPHVEVLLAGTIVTDGDGEYICHRHSMVPNPRHVWFKFPVLTSAIFIRRKVVAERQILFDTRWRDLGDFHWVMSLMKARVPMAVSNEFTSIFADTGENMNLKPNARREMAETHRMVPKWLRLLKPVWVYSHRFRRLFHGHFNLQPTEYALYTKSSPARRRVVQVPKATAIWWNRM